MYYNDDFLSFFIIMYAFCTHYADTLLVIKLLVYCIAVLNSLSKFLNTFVIIALIVKEDGGIKDYWG